MGEEDGETGGENTKEKPINLNYIDDLLNRTDNLCNDVLKCDILNQAFAAIHQIRKCLC